MSSTSHKPGFVYLFHMAGFTKIGASRSPAARLEAFKSLPLECVLGDCFPAADPFALEASLHALFAPYRIRGEWFLLGEDQLAQLRCAASNPPVTPRKARPMTPAESISVRIDGQAGRKLKVLAIHRGMSTAELFDEIMRPIIRNAYTQMAQEILDGD